MARPKKEKPNKNGVYEVKMTIGRDFDGKAIRKSFYSARSKEAARRAGEQWIIDREVALRTGVNESLSDMTFSRQADIVLDLKKGKVRASSYRTVWIAAARRLKEYFGNRPLVNITKNDIEMYFKGKSDYSKGTLTHDVIVLKAIFSNAIDNRILVYSPMQNFRLEVGRRAEQKRVYTDEQVIYVMKYLSENMSNYKARKQRIALAIELMILFGMSRSETLGIMNEDIDYENKTIIIKQGVTLQDGKVTVSETKTAFRKRTVAISEEMAEQIKTLGISSRYLISVSSEKPMHPNTFSKLFNEIMAQMNEFYKEKEIDVPALNPHELRHTRASIWVNSGKNLFAIAQQMGWADLKMLRQRYAHGDISQLRKELDL